MAQRADVVVLGAGVVGCAIAYYLSRRGVRVVVVERDEVGSAASGYALGGLNPLLGSYISSYAGPLAEASFEMHRKLWPQLEQTVDVDIQARVIPHLDICMSSEEVSNSQSELIRWAGMKNFVTRWLEPDEVHCREPLVNRELMGAVLVEDVGVVDSYRFTLSMSKMAEMNGTEFVVGEVISLIFSGGRVTGVVLRDGEISCGATVVALGPWSGQIGGWLGLEIPVSPLKGQIVHVEGFGQVLRHSLGRECTVLSKEDGLIWIGSTEEDVGFDTNITSEAREILMKKSAIILPRLSEQYFVRQTVCFRPITPDRLPVLGLVPGWEGVFLATGAGKKGILLAPAIGSAIADLIIQGETEMPIESLTIERFN